MALGTDDKRDALRVPCDFPIRVYGQMREVDGRMLNISRTGLRLSLPLARLMVTEEFSFEAIQHAVEQILGANFLADLHHEMLGPLIRKRIRTVRVGTIDPDANELEVGCCFEDALNDDETVMLGIGLPPVGVTTAAAFKDVPPPKHRYDSDEDHPAQPRPDDYEGILHPSEGHVIDPLVGSTEGGPGEEVLLTVPVDQLLGLPRVDSGVPLDAVKSAFGPRPRIEILDGLLMIWAGPVLVQEIEMPEDRKGGALILLRKDADVTDDDGTPTES